MSLALLHYRRNDSHFAFLSLNLASLLISRTSQACQVLFHRPNLLEFESTHYEEKSSACCTEKSRNRFDLPVLYAVLCVIQLCLSQVVVQL